MIFNSSKLSEDICNVSKDVFSISKFHEISLVNFQLIYELCVTKIYITHISYSKDKIINTKVTLHSNSWPFT